MTKKIGNAENIKNLKKRERLRSGIILFSILTIILAFLNLFYEVNILFALFSFIITTILNKIREKTVIQKKDDLEEIRNEIKENKRKYGKK